MPGQVLGTPWPSHRTPDLHEVFPEEEVLPVLRALGASQGLPQACTPGGNDWQGLVGVSGRLYPGIRGLLHAPRLLSSLVFALQASGLCSCNPAAQGLLLARTN